MLLADFGADVVKVEHPRGDGLRSMGWEKDGVSLWWALVGRNKRSVTLKLSEPRGAELDLFLGRGLLWFESFASRRQDG